MIWRRGSVQRRVTAWRQTALYLVMFFYSWSTRFVNWFTFILVIFPFKFFKVHEGNPPPSHVIVSQLIWREFFYTMSANNPFYAEIFRKPAFICKGCVLCNAQSSCSFDSSFIKHFSSSTEIQQKLLGNQVRSPARGSNREKKD